MITEQKMLSEKTLAEEKARQVKKEAELKARQEQQLAERKRAILFTSIAAAFVTMLTIFFLLYQRQKNLKQKAIEKAETAHKMAELELQSLRAQLNPHFMFNSLNAIQELIMMEENDKGNAYLVRFAKLLRMLLDNANSPFIPLARELEFLELYLSLENLRIPDMKYRLIIDPAIDLQAIKIPNMILQPFMENAIWHGLSNKKAGDRRLELRVHSGTSGVTYEVEDNGVGRKKAAELKSAFRKEHRSKGMELLTRRFKLLNEEYRNEIVTKITDLEEDHIIAGTLVTITVPWALSSDLKKIAS
jgi:LytS/YehU family sensor histidine kinase